MAGHFQVITYDVEHGSCHVLRTPNDHIIMIDAGRKSDFSPAIHLYNNWGVRNLKWLTITHHDSDHLTDINNIAEYIPPKTLERPTVDIHKLSELYTEEFSTPLEVFLEFGKNYNIPAPPMSDSAHYSWGGVQFAVFKIEYHELEKPNINDLSVVTFAHYMGWTIIFPGDLEKPGWMKLLENPDFIYWLKKVNIFIASHHGRESGYYEDIFHHFNPHLTIVSDKSISDTSITDKYHRLSQGLRVEGESDKRFVLSTRSDGAILVDIDEEGRYLIRRIKTT